MKRHDRTGFPCLESLEPRTLLAVGPDITGSMNDRVLLTTLVPGETAKIRVSITNQGDQIAAASSFTVKIILSTDEFADASDPVLGSWTSEGQVTLDAGTGVTGNIAVQVPPGMAPGQYKTLLWLDSDNNVAGESDLLNNVVVSQAADGNDLERNVVWKFGSFDGRRKMQLVLRGPDGGDTGGATFFRLTGAGYGEVTPNPGGDGYLVTIRNTNKASSAWIWSTAEAQSKLESLIVEGASIKSISAATQALIGDLRVDGACASISLGSAGTANAEDISMTFGTVPKATLTASLGNVANVQFSSDSPIRSLNAIQWLDSSETSGLAGDEVDILNAPSIAKLKITGKKGGPAGDFMASVDVDGGAKTGLGVATIAGDVVGGNWSVSGGIKSLAVNGSVLDSTIRSTGNVGSVKFGAFKDSNFLVGVDAAQVVRAQGADDFVSACTIGKFVVTGRIPGATDDMRFVENAQISSAKIRIVSFANLNIDNGGETFGLWVKDIPGVWNEVKSVSASDSSEGFSWTWRPVKEGGFTFLNDFAVTTL